MAVNGIDGINPVSAGGFAIDKTDESGSVGESFADILANAVEKVNDLQLESDELTEEFAAGRTDNIHQVLIAAEKADVSLQFAMQVRNKIMDAYNEIMRIAI